MSKPIRPSEVPELLNSSIPDVVIDAFNELIVKDFRGSSAIVFQKDVIALLEKKGLKRNEIYEKRWLDVENLFSKHGWTVEYDKPGYNESYEPHFKFSSKRGSSDL